jgi:hypothetical protein
MIDKMIRSRRYLSQHIPPPRLPPHHGNHRILHLEGGGFVPGLLTPQTLTTNTSLSLSLSFPTLRSAPQCFLSPSPRLHFTISAIMLSTPPVHLLQSPHGGLMLFGNMCLTSHCLFLSPSWLASANNTYYSDLSPYNMREWTCIISCTIWAGRPWAHGKNILDYDGWAGRNIIPDAGGWAHAGNM